MHDHLKRSLENYKKLKETAILIPKPKPLIHDVETLVKRARYRFEETRE